MRYIVISLLLLASGCLAVQEPHNPTKKPEGVAPVSSASAAPVESEVPTPSRVDLMKAMYSAQRDLNQQILQMAGSLTEEELAEFNEWLEQFGVQLQRKKKPQSEVY